jgi:hypothetical protein
MTIDEQRCTTQDYRQNHGIHPHFVNNPPAIGFIASEIEVHVVAGDP